MRLVKMKNQTYTQIEHETWSLLISRRKKTLTKEASQIYLEGIEK